MDNSRTISQLVCSSKRHEKRPSDQFDVKVHKGNYWFHHIMKTSPVRLLLPTLTTAAILCGSGLQAAESLKVFYGLLHAHTFFSDGQGTPEEAFQAAKAAGLDFFAVTPHNH